jgi:hypothetical protein
MAFVDVTFIIMLMMVRGIGIEKNVVVVMLERIILECNISFDC